MFENPRHYPHLEGLRDSWLLFANEVLPVLFAARSLNDERCRAGDWSVMPFLVEEEDRHVFDDEIVALCRGYAPNLCKSVDSLPGIRAYALSIVQPFGEIRAHSHRNPFASASICLAADSGVHIEVQGKRRPCFPGSMSIFDYRRPHRVVNASHQPRVALVIAVDLARSYADELPRFRP